MKQITDFDHYQSLAVRTIKQEAKPRMMLHCIMGIAGETGELFELKFNDTKITGELGDCMWYLANLFTLLDRKMQDAINAMYNPEGNERYVMPTIARDCMVIHAAQLIDYIKKSEFYGKEPDLAKIEDIACNYLSALLAECVYQGIEPLKAAQSNILKLEARYPGNFFDADQAINRDYSAESKAAGIDIA